MTGSKTPDTKPNILMIMVDQMRYPRFGYGSNHGFHDDLKQIFAFRNSTAGTNEWEKYFPDLTALRDNAVVLSNHRCASSACVPSRSVLFSGQYGTITGATQTDGIFKNGANRAFPWMDPDDFPTIGDWMREADYTTHYFGKWHISGESTPDLEAYGFSDWDLSYPDPHGTLPNNLGHYRDYQFEDLVTSFLRRQGLGMPYNIAHAEHNVTQNSLNPLDDAPEPSTTQAPWFAVASFTNPHDIGAYPGLPRTVYPKMVDGKPYTVAVPDQEAPSTLPKGGTMSLVLNKDGFPQQNAAAAATWNEKLRDNNKPDCHFDYTYKMGLTLAAKAGYKFVESLPPENQSDTATAMDRAVQFALNTNVQGLPLTLTDDPEAACDAFMQYYGYVIYEVDKHINNVLNALEESGQADNTIIIFTPDHGEYGGAHQQMTEKWHSAYEEYTHIPAVVRFPKKMSIADGWQEITEPTSHADLLPTVLGLAGIDEVQRQDILAHFQDKNHESYHAKAYGPVGTDISGTIKDTTQPIRDQNGNVREGVLFMTHDTITEPLPKRREGNKKFGETEEFTTYDVFLETVETLRKAAQNKSLEYPEEAQYLKPGSVCGPHLVHSVVDRENWKLVRYFSDPDKFDSNTSSDASGFDPGEQFELYDLNADPQELNNLVIYNASYGTLIDDVQSLSYYQPGYEQTVSDKAASLKLLLKTLEREMLNQA